FKLLGLDNGSGLGFGEQGAEGRDTRDVTGFGMHLGHCYVSLKSTSLLDMESGRAAALHHFATLARHDTHYR
ncbi:MAG TPA: hypothetical protein VJ652_18500, partial [Noviherbaspirillum sp.]|nr:hypothetical protein [Noviherbaspirillum sp.]